MVYKNSEAIKKEKQDSVLNKITQNPNHHHIAGCYENKNSELVVYCGLHDSTQTTTFDNYRRAKTGMACCGKKSTSDTLTNRVYSPETRERMSLGAKLRPPRETGSGQHWRNKVTPSYLKTARELWHHECAITGAKTNLEVHHLFLGSKKPTTLSEVHERFRYDPKAAILISKKVHKGFHNDFGYENTTLKHFILFVEKLISSQVHPEWWKGSETRGERPERLQNLHERLVQTEQDLGL